MRVITPSANSHTKVGPRWLLRLGVFGLLTRKPAAFTTVMASSSDMTHTSLPEKESAARGNGRRRGHHRPHSTRGRCREFDDETHERERHRVLIRLESIDPSPNSAQPIDRGPPIAACDRFLRSADLVQQGYSPACRTVCGAWSAS